MRSQTGFQRDLGWVNKGLYDTGCLQKRLGTAWPFLSHIPVVYVTRDGGVALPGVFAASFPFPSKPFPDAAGSRADSHKLQQPLEPGGRFLTEPATHRGAASPLPGDARGGAAGGMLPPGRSR